MELAIWVERERMDVLAMSAIVSVVVQNNSKEMDQPINSTGGMVIRSS